MSKKKAAQLQEDWLNEAPQFEWWPQFENWRGGHNDWTIAHYVQRWIEACADHPTGIQASSADGSWNEVSKKIDGANRFGLRLYLNESGAISDKLIHTLEVNGPGPFSLSRCAIKVLELRQGQLSTVRLEGCKIDQLLLRKDCLSTFVMIGCSIRQTSAPTPSQTSPFTGSVEIRSSKFSTAFENAQAYRNLRHHLSALHNHEAASVFHAAEMEAEAGKQSVVDKAISFFYRRLSNYGGSSARPLVVCAAFVFVNFLMLFITDGVATLGDAREIDGWHYNLYGFDDQAKLLRATVFSINQMFNPLGIFGTRLLLTARTPELALASTLLGLASTISFTLFILAVRRRFRLDRSS